MSEGYFAWDGGCGVSESSVAYFKQNGFAIYRSFATDHEIDALRKAADSIVRDPQFVPPEKAIFTTVDQDRKMDDEYFLGSASTIRCFREEKSQFQRSNNASALKLDRDRTALEINKIGHALHDLDRVFCAFSYSDNVQQIAEGFGLCSDPLVVQSMYIFKQPFIGGSVQPHRDATFIISEPDTCLGLWWALEDSTMTNGCLWAVPGSHKDGVRKRFVLNRQARTTEFVGEEDVFYRQDAYKPLPMRKGDLVVLHGALMHMSLENSSPHSRHAYSIHLVDSKYSDESWLQRPVEMPFRSLKNPPNFASMRNLVGGDLK